MTNASGELPTLVPKVDDSDTAAPGLAMVEMSITETVLLAKLVT
jgi:hypothetical protein